MLDAAEISERGKPVSGKWKLEILACLSQSPARWSELTKNLPEAAPNVLTRQLRVLESQGLIQRIISSDKPPQVVEYMLSETGRKFIPFLDAFSRWEQSFRNSGSM